MSICLFYHNYTICIFILSWIYLFHNSIMYFFIMFKLDFIYTLPYIYTATIYPFHMYVSSIYLFFHIYLLSIYMLFPYICPFLYIFLCIFVYFMHKSFLCKSFNMFWLSKNKTSYKKRLYAVIIRKKTFWKYNVRVSWQLDYLLLNYYRTWLFIYYFILILSICLW